MIIWSKADGFEREIINDINNSFNLNSVLKVKWGKDFFQQNLGRFYCHSLIEKTEDQKRDILEQKEIHCGNEAFTVVLFDDLAPVLKESKTSSGYSFVNTKVFKKKEDYRRLTGGGHKIHITDNDFEFEKDFLFLFGQYSSDYFDELVANCKKQKLLLNQNLIGVPQWQSISDVFKVLNVTANYVVLRNFEYLPNKYFINGHGDIDLLVDDLLLVKRILNARAVFPSRDYRVYHYVLINGVNVPFDFRYVGDSYYDNKWEKNILDTRQIDNKGFYKVSEKNYFYSLLYHAYVHKRQPSEDYLNRLKTIGSQLKFEISEIFGSVTKTKSLLDDFMHENQYSYQLPLDHSVYFNRNFLEGILNIQKGELISSNFARTKDKAYITEVYKEGPYIKKLGDMDVILNELRGLEAMNESGFTPSLISYNLIDKYPSVTMSFIDGFSLLELKNVKSFWKVSNIRNFVESSLEVLILLVTKNIIHRDIRPNNVIVHFDGQHYKPYLIDFGWSKSISEKTKVLTPDGLGERFRFKGMEFSDMYSMGLILKELFLSFPFVKNVYNDLISLSPTEYKDTEKLIGRLEGILIKYKKSSTGILDHIYAFIKKHELGKFFRRIKKRLLQIIWK